jgi:octaprenyl-diphosphate synthase
MATLSQVSVRQNKVERHSLKQIFSPISCELQAVDECLADILGGVKDGAVREVVEFLLGSPGKRIRPALVLLSTGAVAGAARGSSVLRGVPIEVAAAVELIHMASLVHDDVIDGAAVRHHQPSINARWGAGTAIALGDYLCSHAMAMIAECGDPRLFAILGSDLSAMCEGELLQVAGRTRLARSERHCLDIVEKKTASLFGACCEAGASVAAGEPKVRTALQQAGVHLGIAFQILDDCRDLLSDEEDLGKEPGQDLLAGDMTLPLLYGIRYCRRGGGKRLPLAPDAVGQGELTFISAAFRLSQAPARIRQLVASQVGRAKAHLDAVHDSDFKESLCRLIDYIAVSISDILMR